MKNLLMKRSSTSVLLCITLLFSSTSAIPFEEIIGEDVELFFTIHNFSEVREKYKSHPMAELFEADFVVEWLEETTKSDDGNNEPSLGLAEELEDTFGLSVDELFEFFSGQASLAIYNLSDLIVQKETRPKMILMAEFSGDAEQLDELMQIQFERNAENHKKTNPLAEHEMIKESFMDETLYFDEVFDGENTHIEDGYALVDGVLILATPESLLREAIELVKTNERASISKSDAYQRYREHTDAADMTFYLNLVELMPPLNSALLELPIFESLALFGVTAQSLETAISLESLQALYTDFELVKDGLLLKYGILFSEKLGFLSLVNYADDGLPEALYVPEDVLSSSVSRFDLNVMLANFEKILGLASPALPPIIDMQLQTMQADIGVDLRTSILENFGNEIVNFSVLKKDSRDQDQLLQQQQIFAIDLKDPQAFRNAVNALKDTLPTKSLIEEQLYEGETIYSLTQPETPDAPEMQFNYVITRSKLLLNIGHVSLLHEALTAIGKDTEGFWQTPEIINLFERIEHPNAVARNFLDLEQFMSPFFKLLAEGETDDLPAFIKSGKIPEELKKPYRLISEVNEEPGSIFGRALVIKTVEN